MAVEKLLRSTLISTDTYEQLIPIVDYTASQSTALKRWIDNLIKPVLLMVDMASAEHEADWRQHVWAVDERLPCFFASNHCNYAR